MTLLLEPQDDYVRDPELDEPRDPTPHLTLGPIPAALALLSVAAGFLHAAVIEAHRGHGVAPTVFGILAFFQLGWAVLLLLRPNRAVLALGAAGNLAIVLGYIVSRTSGISVINGFQDVEKVGVTDLVTTAFEVLIVAGAALLLFPAVRERLWPTSRLSLAGLGAIGLAVTLAGVPAAAGAGHHHDHEGAGHTHDHTLLAAGGAGAVHVHNHSAVPSYKDITPAERARAEKLLADTKSGLWQWADEAKVYAAGFRTIGDGATGTEHLVNWAWITDNHILDPNHPESLVYRTTPGGHRVLEAAMYMANPGTPPDQLPNIGGPLTQWHIHNNLCLSAARMVDGAIQRTVVGVTSENGPCRTGENLKPFAPMLHVWVVPHKCGPFAALDGIGAGQAVTPTDPNAPVDCQHIH